MTYSTFAVSDFQYLQALRPLLPTALLKQAVAAAPRRTRQRLLPAHLVLATLVAWFFHPQAKLPFIARWLCRRPDTLPSDSALYQSRARLGWAPLRWLCQRVRRPLAEGTLDPSAFYLGRRLLAIDGTTFTVADTPANDRTFGRAGNQHGRSGYPLMRLVALCEVGTHALLHWITRSYRVGEQTLAARLWRHVPAASLLLGDRNFHCYPLWAAAAAGGWELLLRLQAGPKFAVGQVLGDGSFLSWVYPRRGMGKKGRAIGVRVITYCWTDAQGKVHTSRLLTSLLDAAAHPARVLVELYHRRWEQEGVFREIKSALAGRVTQVRAQEPRRALQELDGLLLGHFVVRWLMLQAAREKGVAPVSISFTGALRVLQTRLGTVPAAAAARRQWWQKMTAGLGKEKTPPRRQRSCPRKKKVTRSAWPVKRKEDKQQGVPILVIVPPTAA
jgi:DDE family transposase/transposase IS4-like protein